MIILVLINIIFIVCVYLKYYKFPKDIDVDNIENEESIVIGYVNDLNFNNNFDLILAEIIELNVKGYIKISYNKDSIQKYDYIIMDLPPVTSVSDALIVSQYVNGIIIVARQNYAYKKSFAETVRQLEQVNAKILGVVFNASHESSSGYGKKYKKYGKHYMAYYKTYQKAYEDAERR